MHGKDKMEENTYYFCNEELVCKVNDTMPPEEEMKELADYFKVNYRKDFLNL